MRGGRDEGSDCIRAGTAFALPFCRGGLGGSNDPTEFGEDLKATERDFARKQQHQLADKAALERALRRPRRRPRSLRFRVEGDRTDGGAGAERNQALRIAQPRRSTIGSTDLVEFANQLVTKAGPQTVSNYLSHLAILLAIARPARGYPLDQLALAVRPC